MAKLLVEYGRARRGESAVLKSGWLDSLAHPIVPVSLIADGKAVLVGDAQMGLGHFVHVGRGGRRMLFHSGGNPGVAAYFLVDLDRDGGIFVAVNADVSKAAGVVAQMMAAWGAWNKTDPPVLF